ncbi:MAG TPA: DUF2752 domain-containing protein [Mycobacteriales bacterium]
MSPARAVAVRATATRAAYAAGAACAVVLAGAVTPWRPATLCFLRASTGVPCPFCGTTTAAEAAAHGDLLGAVAANPVTVTALVLLVLAPLTTRRLPRSWTPAVFTAAVGIAWVWQLARYDLLPV